MKIENKLGLKAVSRILISFIFALFLFFSSNNALADQTEIIDYNQARKVFWNDLYAGGGQTIYCDKAAIKDDDNSVNIEHIYPASWMKEAASCSDSSREKCRQNSPRFNLMEADLHNLYPSLSNLNKERSNYSYSIIDGMATDDCDFEVKNGLVEPRPASRGNIARAIFYMNDEYGAEIAPPNPNGLDLESLLTYWHCSDPVDSEEEVRNDLIETLQGTRNRFIDNPNLISCSNVAMFAND